MKHQNKNGNGLRTHKSFFLHDLLKNPSKYIWKNGPYKIFLKLEICSDELKRKIFRYLSKNKADLKIWTKKLNRSRDLNQNASDRQIWTILEQTLAEVGESQTDLGKWWVEMNRSEQEWDYGCSFTSEMAQMTRIRLRPPSLRMYCCARDESARLQQIRSLESS